MRRERRLPSGLAWLCATAALALVVAGSLVNSQQAALSVPDWPTSYGSWFPSRWTGNTFWEALHRVIAASVALLLVIFVLVARRRADTIRWVRRLPALALELVAAQIVLGGLIVLLLDPPWVSIVHVLLAQLLFALLFLAAVASAHGWPERGRPPEWCGSLDRKHRNRTRLLVVLVVAQILLGAASRHPYTQGQYILSMVSHLLLGLFVVVIAAIVSAKLARAIRTAPGARWLYGIHMVLLLQLLVGVGVLFVAPEPLDETWPPPAGFPALHAAHHLLSSLLLAGAVTMNLLVKKSLGVGGSRN